MRTLLSILILFVSLSLSLSCRNSSDVEPESKSSLIPSNDFNFETFDCDDCTYIVTDYKTDGKELNIEPGDII